MYAVITFDYNYGPVVFSQEDVTGARVYVQGRTYNIQGGGLSCSLTHTATPNSTGRYVLVCMPRPHVSQTGMTACAQSNTALECKMMLNGQWVRQSITSHGTSWGANQIFRIGCSSSGMTRIYELRVYSDYHSDTAAAAVVQELKTKWGAN